MCSWYCVLPGLKLVVMSELKEFGPIVVQWGTISSYRSGLGVTTGKRREEVSVDALQHQSHQNWCVHFMKANMHLLSLSVDLIGCLTLIYRLLVQSPAKYFKLLFFKCLPSPVLQLWFPRWCCVTKHLALFFSKFYQICLADRPDPASVCLMCSVAWHGQRESPSITQHILTIVN